ncbi:hypothetical protein [Pontibacter cellulosilyticus]|uniref:Uncharacterized protein n=1 Tax=Pontibacter cellulosilyticus TaxID=1720253 RepID=A0A923N5R4_9BACT|nr:hypothetical protein [Pontibacter cellulosilyticus]MBC5993103.1 hypothetical protein [Pontibacter cellulosilyticus]
MLNYEKLSKSARTRTAILLLLLYMVLAMADLLISFFGGIVLGVLFMQFEVEVKKFSKHYFTKESLKSGLLSRYATLSDDQKTFFKAALQVLVLVLMLTGILHLFWGGIISGMLLATIANDLVRKRRKRNKANAARQKH